MARFIKIATRLRLVDDLKMLKITFYHTNQDKGTSSSLKSNITTSYSQDKKKKEVCEHKNEDLHSMIDTKKPDTDTERDLLGVARFPRWVDAKVVSSEVESEKWRRLLLHQMCVAINVATDGSEEDFLPRNGK
ncbi:hypothetical protein Tco_0953976 [Tanacetum coccineum]|uniref:Uncharacterized protein n=1 Tax=Tanacetum coccineum TaxID=301880 RepID=A0ABQ5E1E3_9ASTR